MRPGSFMSDSQGMLRDRGRVRCCARASPRPSSHLEVHEVVVAELEPVLGPRHAAQLLAGAVLRVLGAGLGVGA